MIYATFFFFVRRLIFFLHATCTTTRHNYFFKHMTSQKKTKTKPSLLGTNDLRGGLHLYSADVLTENWFDQRLSPDFSPNTGVSRGIGRRRHSISDAQRQELFNAHNRTDLSVVTGQRKTTNTIPPWIPSDPYFGHPSITNPFETVYECTLGDPKYKTKPIPVGRNWFNYQNIPEASRMITEQRSSFTNPTSREPLEAKYTGGHRNTNMSVNSLSHLSAVGETYDDSHWAAASRNVKNEHVYEPTNSELNKTYLSPTKMLPTSMLGTPPCLQPSSTISPSKWQPIPDY